MNELTPAERRAFRASAHHLSPVVSVSGNGLTPTVLSEIERSLQAHELIKIKVHGFERPQRDALLGEVCSALGAAPVQHIGTILVIWRKRREEATTPSRLGATKGATGKQPAKEKSARAFAAAARRTALIQSAAEKKRSRARRPGPASAKPSPRGR